jgi:hypothetical protein
MDLTVEVVEWQGKGRKGDDAKERLYAHATESLKGSLTKAEA